MPTNTNPEGRINIVRMPTNRDLEILNIEMQLRGFETRDFSGYADDAFNYLSSTREPGLVLVEPMITGSHDMNLGRYNTRRTDGFLETGLCLVQDLIKANPENFPESAIMYSIVDPATPLGIKIYKFCSANKVPLWLSRSFLSSFQLGSELQRAYQMFLQKQAGVIKTK